MELAFADVTQSVLGLVAVVGLIWFWAAKAI